MVHCLDPPPKKKSQLRNPNFLAGFWILDFRLLCSSSSCEAPAGRDFGFWSFDFGFRILDFVHGGKAEVNLTTHFLPEKDMRQPPDYGLRGLRIPLAAG